VQPGQGLGDVEDADAGRHVFDGVLGGGGTLERGLPRRLLPVEDVVEGVEDHLVGEFVEGHLFGRRHDVILGGYDHGRLGVEGDRAEDLTVDRQPYESGVGLTAPQHIGCLGGRNRYEDEGDVGQALVPDPHPLGGRHPGDVREPERGGCFRACHPARLPAVVGGLERGRYS
jgi:hypothetical protein